MPLTCMQCARVCALSMEIVSLPQTWFKLHTALWIFTPLSCRKIGGRLSRNIFGSVRAPQRKLFLQNYLWITGLLNVSTGEENVTRFLSNWTKKILEIFLKTLNYIEYYFDILITLFYLRYLKRNYCSFDRINRLTKSLVKFKNITEYINQSIRMLSMLWRNYSSIAKFS